MPGGLPANVPAGFVAREDEDALIDAIAADFYVHVHNCVRTFGDCHLALSGGRTPQGLYRRLMYDPNYRDIPWTRVHVWATSERASGERTDELLRGLVTDHAGVPEMQVHLPGPGGIDGGAAYAGRLREHLLWREKGHDRLDFVLLGLGPDGGVGGLGPGDVPEPDDSDIVRESAGGVSLSLGMINASRFTAVVALGEQKRPALEPLGRDGRPVDLLRPLAGELRFYVDAGACPRSENGRECGGGGGGGCGGGAC